MQRPIASQSYPAAEDHTWSTQLRQVGGNAGCRCEELRWDNSCCQNGCVLAQSVRRVLEQLETVRPYVATQSASALCCKCQHQSLLGSVGSAWEDFDQSASAGFAPPQPANLPHLDEYASVATAAQDDAPLDVSDASLASTLDDEFFSNPEFGIGSTSAFPASLDIADPEVTDWSKLSPSLGLSPFDLS